MVIMEAVIHKQPPYTFTINTDASFSIAHGGVASWACWIKSAHYLIRDGGVFTTPVANSSVAELMAVEQALLLLDNLIDSQEFLRHYRDNGNIVLYLNTDSVWAIHAMKGIVKRSKHLEVARRVKSLADPFEIIARYVKGHSRNPDSRSWVNNWCDRKARGLVRGKIEELNGTTKREI
jgi:hypothetical protein